MELLEGKKLSDAIEDRLAAALGGDRQLVHDFMQKKQEALMLEADMQEPKPETVARLLETIVAKENRNLFSKMIRKTTLAIQLYSLYKKTRHCVDVLIDVHGHQIFLDGCFNGDPHPVRRYTFVAVGIAA
jgi:aarF domain-containing kinase